MGKLLANKRKLKIITAIVACVLVVAAAAVVLSMVLANAAEYRNIGIGKFKYTLNDSTMQATVTGLSTNGLDLIHADSYKVDIPDTVSHDVGNGVQTFTVTEIGSYAFYAVATATFLEANGSYTLTLPSTLTYIGNNAFFGNTGLVGSLTFPNSITTIGSSAFTNCTGFSGSLILPDSITKIGSSAFNKCTGFSGSLTLPNAITTIEASTFSGCNNFTGSLTIPNSVTSIDNMAFSSCKNLTGLTLSNTLTSIGHTAFAGCSGFVSTLTLPNTLTSIGDSAFSGCTGFNGSLTIPSSVTDIGVSAFRSCKGFDGTLTIIGNQLTIGREAFAMCSGFTGGLTIPSTVASVSEGAFRECTGFNGTLTIAAPLTSIENSTFYLCENLTGSLSIPNTVTTIGVSAFSNCKRLSGSLVIPNSIKEIGANAFAKCSSFDGTLTLSNTLETIGANAFDGCIFLEGSLVIPNTVTSIGNHAFYNCYGFKGTLTLSNSLTKINAHAFRNCSGLTGPLTIPASVTSIEYMAFDGCRGFSGALTIVDTTQNPSQLKSIYANAFYGMNGMTQINIPDSVEFLAHNVFHGWKASAAVLWTENTALTLEKFGYSNFFPANADYYALYQFLLGKEPVLLPEVTNPPFDGSQTITGYESVRTGTNQNSSWLYKSASWTDAGKTTAKLQLDFAHTLAVWPGTDFMFVLDTSDSMGGEPIVRLFGTALYLADGLLNTAGYDNRVAFVTFDGQLRSSSDGGQYAFEDNGFTNDYTKAEKYLGKNLNTVTGNTNYSAPLKKAYDMMCGRTEKSRQTVVIFMTDGEPNAGTSQDGIYGLAQANSIKAGNGVEGDADYLQPTKIYSLAYNTTVSKSLATISSKTYVATDEMAEVFAEIVLDIIGNKPDKLTDTIHSNFTVPANAQYTVFRENVIVAQGTLAQVSAWISLTTTGGVQTLTWKMDSVERDIHYKLIIEGMQLNQVSGEYPVGDLDTNEGNAYVTMPSGTTNEVISPTLQRSDAVEETTKLRVTKVVKNKIGNVIAMQDSDQFFVSLRDQQGGLVGGVSLNKAASTSPWMYLSIADATQLTISETVPMEYSKTYTVSITNGQGSTATLDGKVLTINPGDEVTVTITNTFEHGGFFKGKDSVRNHFTPIS